MDRDTRNAAIAAAVILLAFGVVGFYMPTLMLAAGEASPFVGGILAVAFVLAFFAVFWLRGRSRRNGNRED